MDDNEVRRIQAEASEALLNIGVSIPIKDLRFPLVKRPLRLRVNMKRPCMSGQIAIARTYLSMGVSSSELDKMTKEEEMAFLARHGKSVCRMIAYTLCTGFVSRRLLVGIVSWFVREFVPWEYQMGAMKEFVLLMGTKSFTSIIRSVEMTNPMKLRLSHTMKGS